MKGNHLFPKVIILFIFLLLFSFSSLALIPGDFGSANNGLPDGVVDFEDLMLFALAYGSIPADANWNPNCDIAGPGSTTPDGIIDFEDLMIFAMHYGECSPLTYTATYDGNGSTGGTVPSDVNNYEQGDSVTVLGNTGNLVKTGHTFAGWNTKANGSGTDQAVGSTFNMGSENVTLYAKWMGSDATLSDLSLSSGTLVPTFASVTTSYTAAVANNITSITVTPTAADTNATITVNGTPVASGSASGAISLDVGENTITIVVTAEDGTTTKTYTVIITRAASSAKEIIYFYFGEDDDPAFDDYIDGDINSTLHTVSLAVPYETDVTDLTAYFKLSDEASATVGGTPQESGDTVNDFTSPVIYTVTAEDSSTQNWMVTVYIDPPKTTTDIEEYEFTKADNPALSYDVEGIINYTSHTVSLTVPYGIKNSLIAAFELAAGASATVGGTPQVSGVTANDFTLPVTYTVTAQDGTTTQNWIVTVDEEAVRYVATAANGGDNSNIGSEGSPWLTIQYALNTAPNLCTIIVKDNGPYNETINPPSDRVLILKNASGTTPVINGDLSSCTVGMYGCPEGTMMEGFIITHATGISGKGIYIQNGSHVTINDCTISNNSIGSSAAGLWISLGTNTVTLNDCNISNNTAGGSGGGIYLGSQNSSLTLNNCTISGNQANSGKGGGIEHGTGTLTINGGTISGNSASSNGGGIYKGTGGSLTINGVTISGNSASSGGGGIYNSGGIMTVKGCAISNNKVGDSFSAGICLKGPLAYNFIGGVEEADKNTICSNSITSNSPTLNDQIGDGSISLYGTYSGTNNIEVTCD